MSKMSMGYLGSQIGRLGTAVGSRWKGRDVMRAYQRYVSNPKTTAQQTNRAKFAILGSMASAVRYAALVGMGQTAKELRLTECNVFLKENYGNVIALSPSDITVNYSAITLTKGKLPEASFGAVDFGTGSHLHIEAVIADGGSDQPGAKATDDIYLFAYCPDKGQGVLSSATPRTSDKVSVNVPASWDGMDVHVWGFAVGAKDGDNPCRASGTAYCGTGEVA